MAGQEYLIDTNVAVEYIGETLPEKALFMMDGINDGRTIEIRKQYKTKLPDAIIAATALVNQLTIVTRNTKDFDKIEKVKVLNPYDI